MEPLLWKVGSGRNSSVTILHSKFHEPNIEVINYVLPMRKTSLWTLRCSVRSTSPDRTTQTDRNSRLQLQEMMSRQIDSETKQLNPRYLWPFNPVRHSQTDFHGHESIWRDAFSNRHAGEVSRAYLSETEKYRQSVKRQRDQNNSPSNKKKRTVQESSL